MSKEEIIKKFEDLLLNESYNTKYNKTFDFFVDCLNKNINPKDLLEYIYIAAHNVRGDQDIFYLDDEIEMILRIIEYIGKNEDYVKYFDREYIQEYIERYRVV